MDKKIFNLLITVVLSVGLFAGCTPSQANGVTESDSTSTADSDKISVVCTIFPQYDWVKQIVKDNENIEVSLLLKNGTDLHNYQATADDIVKINDSNLLIYTGGESDAWIEDTIKNAKNKNINYINMMDVLGDEIKEEEVVEGMEEHDDHDDDHEEEKHHHEEVEYDEHVWLSLDNAEITCKAISEKLGTLDTANADEYRQNAENYIKQLEALDDKYEDMVENSARKTILVGDRFPFRYLVDEYDVDYYAAFAGCSAESEASFETVIFLAEKTDELGLPAVLAIDGSDQQIAKTIISNTKNKDQKILVLNSMQSVNSDDISNGETYIQIMEENYKILKEALN